MSRHTSYRGVTIDMEALSRENEKAVALGNMSVNARGDKLGKGGVITKTADQIARENHRIQTAVINTGLKGDVPANPSMPIESKQKPMATAPVSTPVKPTARKAKEMELPNGDIQIDE